MVPFFKEHVFVLLLNSRLLLIVSNQQHVTLKILFGSQWNIFGNIWLLWLSQFKKGSWPLSFRVITISAAVTATLCVCVWVTLENLFLLFCRCLIWEVTVSSWSLWRKKKKKTRMILFQLIFIADIRLEDLASRRPEWSKPSEISADPIFPLQMKTTVDAKIRSLVQRQNNVITSFFWK